MPHSRPAFTSILLAACLICLGAAVAQTVETVTVTGDAVHLIATAPDDTAFGLAKPLLETPRAVTPGQRHHPGPLWRARRRRSHRHHPQRLYRQLLWRRRRGQSARHPGGILFPRLQAGGKSRHLRHAAGRRGRDRHFARAAIGDLWRGQGGRAGEFRAQKRRCRNRRRSRASPMAAIPSAI